MPGKAARVTLLVVLLAVAAAWASARVRQRRARTAWTQPVVVAVLVLGEATPAGVEALRRALDGVERRLDAEFARHRGAAGRALDFEVMGPLRPERLPPTAAPGPGIGDRLGHAWSLWRAAREAHALVPGFAKGAYDVRIYLVAEPGPGHFAEGIGDAGGEVGVVRAGLEDDALLAATATAHEAFHALGATDKYDAAGHAAGPEGLVEPGLVPPYPQRFAELMVGEIPLAPGAGRLPARAAELGVGPVTAMEVGWVGEGR